MPKLKLFIGVEVYGLLVQEAHLFLTREAAEEWYHDYTGVVWGSQDRVPEEYDETKIFEAELEMAIELNGAAKMVKLGGKNGERIWSEKEALASYDKSKSTLPDGYIWLQDNEDQASAECGCTVYRSHKGSGPALILCPMHSAAPDMLKKLKEHLPRITHDGWSENTIKELEALITEAEKGN